MITKEARIANVKAMLMVDVSKAQVFDLRTKAGVSKWQETMTKWVILGRPEATSSDDSRNV